MNSFDRAEARSLSLPKMMDIDEEIVNCDWCSEEVHIGETELVDDIGYRHHFTEAGKMVRVGKPQKIKSRVCQTCLQEQESESRK